MPRRFWAMTLALACAGTTGVAAAGALEECMVVGAAAAVSRCLTDEEQRSTTELATAESAAARRARALEQATARAGPHAALAKSVREFAAYRTAQCNYVKETLASGTGAAEGQIACRIDMNRRRVRELTL